MTQVENRLFETPRVWARHLTDGDVDAMHAVYGDADAMRWVDDGQPLDRAGCARWIDVSRRNYAARGYGMSALVHRADRTVFGFCGLVHPGGQADAEVKYALRREYWGQGLATEVVCGMLAYGARSLGLTRVIATVAPENLASQRVLRKAGMRAMADRFDEDGSRVAVFEWSTGAAGMKDD